MKEIDPVNPNKKFIVTSINATQGGNIHQTHQYSCLSGSVYQPSHSSIEIDVTIQILEPGRNMLRSIEDFEEFLSGPKVHPDAPSYQELLASYHPEFLL
jgi:hypothetical protein